MVEKKKLCLDEKIDAAKYGKDLTARQRVWNEFFAKYFAGYTVGWFADKLVEGDPIAAVADIGHTMITTAECVLGGLVALKATVAIAKGSIFGRIANTATGVGNGISKVIETIGPQLFLALLVLWINGAMLAYFLPFIPFLLFWSAAVGCILLYIQALFAAPFWAIAQISSQGEGFLGENGKTGFMMLFSILTRPVLMICGFLVSIVIMGKIGHYIGMAIKIAIGTGPAADHAFGPTGAFVMIFLLSGLFITLFHKIFRLVTDFPDQIPRWIGQLYHSIGDQSDADLGKIRDGTSSGTKKAEGYARNALSSMKNTAGGHGSSARKQKRIGRNKNKDLI